MSSPSIAAAKRILRYRPPLPLAVAGCVVIALAAWLWPLSPPPADEQDLRGAFDAQLPGKPAPEDLTAFLTSKRWGRSLADRREQAANSTPDAAEPPASAINPQLARVGLFAVTRHAGEYAVLMALPDDRSKRLHPGDVLRDGRTLVAVDGNSVTLRDSTGAEAKLVLFPKASLAEAQGDVQASTAAPQPAPESEGETSPQ